MNQAFKNNMMIGFSPELLIGLPLLGIVWSGKGLAQYLEFPPTTRYVEHAAFSWMAFAALAVLIGAMVVPFIVCVIRSGRLPDQSVPRPLPAGSFPWWGWLGLVFGAIAWCLAWTRFPWFAALQPYTFSPLWFAYILVINTLTLARTGRCMLTHRTRHLILLFLASASFWWFFEYLNRFVQNWYYVGIRALTPWDYFIFATLPFSTVLPAVMGTSELLATFPRLSAGLEHAWPVRVNHSRKWAVVTLVVSMAGLAGIGVRPDLLFPLLWLAPLLILTSLQVLQGKDTVLTGLERGNWRRVFLLAVSALICGFFWEMWNYYSLAKWIYAVPYVNRFHLFEMPVLGYAGYLPFGLECAAMAMIIERDKGVKGPRGSGLR